MRKEGISLLIKMCEAKRKEHQNNYVGLKRLLEC